MAKSPEEVLAKAKAAHKADSSNKELKKAYKTAKKAAAAWKVEQEAVAAAAAAKEAKKSAKKDKKRKAAEVEVEAPAKKAKVDLPSLKAAAKAAKAAHKADPSDAALKAAHKAARKAAKDFEAAPVEAAVEAVVETPVAKPAEVEEAPLKKAAAVGDGAAVPANASVKLFLGNISWDMDDDTITEFFKDCGTLVDIFWLTDKEDGRFKGCGFVTFETIEQAVLAQKKEGEIVAGRDIKIEFAAPRPGGETRGKKTASGANSRPMSERPENCTTVFAGNLSWDVDDDSMREFCKESGEVKAIRWLTDKTSGEFRGCGFIEFWDTDSVDNFIKKNGEDCCGRPIKLDYSAPRPKQEW